jgi:hypothetical protein
MGPKKRRLRPRWSQLRLLFEMAMAFRSTRPAMPICALPKSPVLGQRNEVRFLNETLYSVLAEQTHLLAIKVMHTKTPRRRCMRLQSFNSSGPLANSRNGEPFRKRIDRPRRHGGGSPRLRWSRSMREGSALVLPTAASGWFDLRRRRRGTDGHARRSDVLAVAGRIPSQDRAGKRTGPDVTACRNPAL